MGYVKHTLIIFINFALIYALIDKRKPITGMGCLEFVKMSKKKFRAELYKAYVASGIHDHALIQEYIKVAEAFVLDNQEITVSGFRALTEKISTNNGHSNGSRALGGE